MAEWPARKSTPWDISLRSYIDDANATKRDISEPITLTELAATGVRSAATFLRGDGVWATIDGVVDPGTDSSPPSIPANVQALEVRSTSIRVGWDAATDNVSVTGYEVTVNNVVKAGPVVGLYVDIPSLTPATNYTIKVRARDAAGNYSGYSTPLTLTTLAGASTGYPDGSNSPYKDSEGVLHFYPNYPSDVIESTQALTETSGVIYTQNDNQTIENLFVNGGVIIVRHHNVTIRRCYFKCTPTYFSSVIAQDGGTLANTTNYGATVEDCCFDGNDIPGGTPLQGVGLTVRRCNIFRADNGGQGEDEQTWEDNFFHDMATFTAEAHSDLIQFDNGPDWPVRNWTARHNTFLSRTVDGQGTTSCIITNQDSQSGHMENITIEDNIFAGGAYSLYGPTRNMPDFVLNNNKFWTLYYPTVGAFGPSANGLDVMNTSGNSVGAFSGGLVNNAIQGSWVHDHFIGNPGGTSDTTAPTTPVGLAAVDISSSGFTVTWSPSVDDIGVTGYEVYLDNVSQGVVSVTSKTFVGLTGGQTYAVKVRARDAAGNWSSQSSPLSVDTLADSSYVIKSVTISSSLPSSGTQTVVTGEDIPTEVGDFVLLLQFSDYRLKSQVGLPVANGSITATEIVFPGIDNGAKFRASYYFATTDGAQTIVGTTSSPADDDKRLVAIVISGVDSSDPVDVFASADTGSSVNGGAGENFYQTPAVTTTDVAKLIISVIALGFSRTYSSAESGYTLLKNETAVGGFLSYSIIYGIQADAGSTGTIDHLYSSSGTALVSATIALNPA